MTKQLDKVIADKLKEHGFDKSAVWDCHGTWVILHAVLEKIAAKEKIKFQQPFVCSSTIDNIAMCVTGDMGDMSEWSMGEATPKNCKNAYPWAMAEKRAKDRVILKLIGLAGFVYSEEEVYDLKGKGKGVWEAPKWHGPVQRSKFSDVVIQFNKELDECETKEQFEICKHNHKELRDQIALDTPKDAKLKNPDCTSGETTKAHISRLHMMFEQQDEIDQQESR